MFFVQDEKAARKLKGGDKGRRCAWGNMKLHEIGALYRRQRLEYVLDAAKRGSPDLLTLVQELKLSAVPEDKRRELAHALYCSGKRALAKQIFDGALTSFRLAHKLAPSDKLFVSRATLLDSAIAERGAVPWQMSLMTLQHALGVTCVKSHCTCTSHIEIARCRHLVSDGLRDCRGGVTIHTLAPYYPYSPGDYWTRLLRAVKKQFQSDLLDPIGDIAADFLLELLGILDNADVVVPVPPSTEKFANRGFAPNDLLARRISARLALPFKPILQRKTGLATRAATTNELTKQFEVPATDAQGINGLSVLLVELRCPSYGPVLTTSCAHF
jgi:predicted amidophosphoribosyltransferase